MQWPKGVSRCIYTYNHIDKFPNAFKNGETDIIAQWHIYPYNTYYLIFVEIYKYINKYISRREEGKDAGKKVCVYI